MRFQRGRAFFFRVSMEPVIPRAAGPSSGPLASAHTEYSTEYFGSHTDLCGWRGICARVLQYQPSTPCRHRGRVRLGGRDGGMTHGSLSPRPKTGPKFPMSTKAGLRLHLPSAALCCRVCSSIGMLCPRGIDRGVLGLCGPPLVSFPGTGHSRRVTYLASPIWAG